MAYVRQDVFLTHLLLWSVLAKDCTLQIANMSTH